MEDSKMKWQKDFETFFSLYNSFVFEGYIDDDQPFEEKDGSISYCRLEDYFDKIYSNHKTADLRRRVVIYDPTESEDKRFHICDNGELTEEIDPDNPDGEPKKKMHYESKMSQHLWDILYDTDLNELLIEHNSSGPAFDFSLMHYALTEQSGRLELFEHPAKFVELFDSLFGAAKDPNEPNGYLFVVTMTSRLLSRDGQSSVMNNDELKMFRQLLNIAQTLDMEKDGKRSPNKLVILANQLRDLPSWFTDELANPFIKIINVSRPSEDNKLRFFHEMLEDPKCFSAEFHRRYNELNDDGKDGKSAKRNKTEKKFLAYTNDFSMNMLRKYRDFVVDNPVEDPNNLGFNISKFRVGDMTNPWDDEERIKEMLNIKDTVSKKIKGQNEALDMAQNILTRAALGLDRAQNPNAPRVVLFLAGPTGTGKTELCKQIAECIFGSEERIVRFDMSEYGQEESDQKLFGAPPGYVGYEEGGKLTNAIKKEPFSLILFDEIEKAHNSILDKFLQILGDGRLTDGKGETVRFTDCIIVITSNAGVMSFKDTQMTQDRIDELMNGDKKPKGEMNMEKVLELEEQGETPKEIYNLVREHLRYNVKCYFHCKLQRPELYGRIENSLVYYNYIGKDSVAPIVESTVKSAIKSTKEMMRVAAFDEQAVARVQAKIADYCQNGKVRALGARGIIKSTEKLFTGSLSNKLSDYVRGVDNLKRSDLVGKTLTCECPDVIHDVSEIKWYVRD